MPEELEPIVEVDPQEEQLRAIEGRASEIARLIRQKNMYKERTDDLDAQKVVTKLETEIDTVLAKDGLVVVADKIVADKLAVEAVVEEPITK